MKSYYMVTFKYSEDIFCSDGFPSGPGFES